MDGVIPVTVKLRTSQEQTVHFGVRHLHAKGYSRVSSLAFTRSPVVVRTLPNELHDRLVIDQRTAAPVFGDMAEQPMLDLVPFRRSRWKMRHADGKTGAVREALQLEFPEARAGAVAAACTPQEPTPRQAQGGTRDGDRRELVSPRRDGRPTGATLIVVRHLLSQNLPQLPLSERHERGLSCLSLMTCWRRNSPPNEPRYLPSDRLRRTAPSKGAS